VSPRRVAIRCPGKVNLHLEVVRRRPDGFHELRTLFAAVGIRDRLELAATPDGSLELAVEPAGAVGAGPDNLVLRAARAARAAWGVEEGARITLHKGIPVAGGMGGGSADAAATLVALAALWRRPQPTDALLALGAALGSDVPYFLVGGAAWGEGRGERLRALPDLPPWWVVLVPGDQPVPTAEVYRRLRPADIGRGGAEPVYDWLAGGGELPLSALRNDLEGAVTAGWPWVGERLVAVRSAGASVALVSGSGGTVFGLWSDELGARDGAARCEPFAPVVAPLLGRDRSLLQPFVEEES
jgi:4-diphosphocytidyl-2C-methyl-D-erythritol kinase